MPYSRPQLFELSQKIGRSWRTLQYWAAQGCNLNDPKSVRAFLTAKELRKTNAQKARERRGIGARKTHRVQHATPSARASGSTGNGELPPAGPKGAQFALARLEVEEAQAHRRLQLALGRGNPIEIESAQQFWVRCVESLQKLDLSIELARRDAEQQVPLRVAQDTITAAAEWLRISIMQFLSSEGVVMAAGFESPAKFKVYFLERFGGVLDLTVRAADTTRSALPAWAKERIAIAWNVKLDEPAKGEET